MIGNLYTEAARDAWVTVPGRSKDFVVDANGNYTKITYSENNNVVFAQYLTYDANNNCIKIECKES